MALSDARWKEITPSELPWEREALSFIRERLPDHEPYRAWANFEFVAENGKIYEVDLLVLTPKGFFLVEIKSRPGLLQGDTHTWTWSHDGRKVSHDNPLILADRKAKRLKSLLAKQKPMQKVRLPYLQALVFCSAAQLSLQLDPAARHNVYTRDTDTVPDARARAGIVAALCRWSAGAAGDPGAHRIDRPTAKAVARALEDAGIRPSQRSRRVGDYVLGELIDEGPTYQDWAAEHAAVNGVTARVRLYPLALGASESARQTLQRAAEREFRILQGIHHAGILRAEWFTIHERGPALIFAYDPKAVRLDHFLLERGRDLTVDQRLGLLRQIAEALRYAHEKKLVHRALSPLSILVSDPDAALPKILIFNWQTGAREGSSSSGGARTSGTAHPEQLVDDASLVYMAPEVVAGNLDAGEYADVFSLGAIAFHLFAAKAPAASVLQRDQMLRAGSGLDLSAVVDGVGKALRELVQLGTYPEVTGRIESVDEFLEYMTLVEEELTAPEEEPVNDPTEARAKDRLPGGFVVVKRLGRGSSAVTFLVEHAGGESVLKVAADPDCNDRLRAEADVLQKLRHERIVAFHRLVDVGDRAGIVMDKAGDETLGQRIRTEGRLHAELLQRFGEELLQAVAYLEESGIAHRDIKPDNIGVTTGIAKDRLHIVLFDFSLARIPADNIRAGTRPYLDPFLSLRRPPRWDVFAERFAAAVNLYEMATGTVPRWGDGQSDPALTRDEVTIEAELFEADLRQPLTAFFRKALARDYRKRFDTCEEMLRSWRRVFEGAEPRQQEDETQPAESLRQLLPNIGEETQVALLPVSARALTAMDRLGVATAGDLLRVPLMRINGMRGVGNKTRREIRALVETLSRYLTVEPLAQVTSRASPAAQSAPSQVASGWQGSSRQDEKLADGTREEAEDYGLPVASIDVLLNRLLPARAQVRGSEESALRLFLGLNDMPVPAVMGWPSQTDVASACSLTRARISQVVVQARRRWSKNPNLTALRDEIAGLLDAQGGVISVEELAAAILATRGSAVRDETQRLRAARAVARAAVEAEHERAELRFVVRRTAAAVLLGRSLALADYAERLGRIADRLAGEDPLPSPRTVLEALAAVRPPPGTVVDPGRLPHLAAAASSRAAVSSRLEIYPRGMAAARAVKLAHAAFLGTGELPVDEIRQRVQSRYPLAEGLPGRPLLDDLLRDAGWDFVWVPDAAGGAGAYRTPLSLLESESSGSSSLGRYPTTGPPRERTPEVATAEQFEERLRRALGSGTFLALTIRPRELRLADGVLASHFHVERISLERLMLDALREVAAAANVRWNVVLAADTAAPDSRDWKNLMTLVGRAVPKVKERLLTSDKTLLLTYPGLLARYGQLGLIDALRERVGQRDGPPGVWLLIPSDDQQTMPVIDGHAVPVITPGQWARIPDPWVQNRHRSAREPDLKIE